MTNQTVRVLELLKRFNDGQKVCIDALKNDMLWEGKNEKTIRRDLDIIKELFPDSFELIRGGKGEKGCYKAITKQAFDNFLKPQTLSLMVQVFNIAQRSDLFDEFEISKDDKTILSAKIKQIGQAFEFKNKPFESKKDDQVLFGKLQECILKQKYVIIEYPSNDGWKKIEVMPYKMVFMNENFYLACAVEHEEYEFSIFRISKIKNIEETKKTYQMNFDIADFIKYMQTPFALYRKNYRQHLIEVVLEVDASKAYFFGAKKFLSSQNIIDTKENGNVLVSYKVTQEREIEDFIKQWIPHVKIVSPATLRDKITAELSQYLAATK
ncbi:MAG: WYL domain-containing protein [Sulfurimonas sp.]|uniref:helix-turn-helix transcriptional regulator n=1 Tax=Sulfurimonas sp. TaxID=2022749 RepID=UPI00262A8DB9|nr:WYL domain-containing protein [Sulfurimonas sp.]MDD2651684.1 WYL domain-containing protein [Sulfurimonas sp.]MDD3451495.1 WYL domain-containing protein [Sulfurimonas sp.]